MVVVVRTRRNKPAYPTPSHDPYSSTFLFYSILGGESDAERQDLLLRIHSQDARILELRRRCKAERDQKMKTLDGLRKRMLALESVVVLLVLQLCAGSVVDVAT